MVYKYNTQKFEVLIFDSKNHHIHHGVSVLACTRWLVVTYSNVVRQTDWPTKLNYFSFFVIFEWLCCFLPLYTTTRSTTLNNHLFYTYVLRLKGPMLTFTSTSMDLWLGTYITTWIWNTYVNNYKSKPLKEILVLLAKNTKRCITRWWQQWKWKWKWMDSKGLAPPPPSIHLPGLIAKSWKNCTINNLFHFSVRGFVTDWFLRICGSTCMYVYMYVYSW
jgi:hypothetical protein